MALDVGTLKVTLEADDSGLDGALKAAQQRLERMDTVGAAASRTLRSVSLPADLASDLRNADQRLQQLDAGADGAARSARRIEMPADFERNVRGARDELDRTAAAANQAGDEISSSLGDSAGAESGGGFMGGFSEKIKGLGGKGGPIATALVGVAGLGLAAGAVIAGAISDGMAMQQSRADFQGALGLDDATTARAGKAAGDAYVQNFGESVEGNLEGLTAGFDFGLVNSESTSDEMQNLISKAETLNGLLDTETPDALRGVSALVKSGLVPDVNAAFDLMVAGRREGLNAQGDLIDTLSEYSVGWKNTGLSAQTSLALIKQSMDLGVDNTDRGADAIREFGRRVSEEGDTIVTALDDIGLNGAEMFDAFKRGGPDAEAAFDQAFDAIRAIEDPVARNSAAMALLGDTAGDFIGAFTQWDPSAAVDKFGQVEGAADKAANTIGGTTASSIESAKRSIETSSDAIKLALANAFGPGLEKAASWVSSHRGEVIGFFTDLADAGFVALDGILAFSSGTLRAIAQMADGMDTLFGGLLRTLGSFSAQVGSIVKYIPGMEGAGKAMELAGNAANMLGENLAVSGERATAAADAIDNTIRPAVRDMREDVAAAGGAAEDSARLMQALGADVLAIPDGRRIIISSNSPEQAAQLQALGLQVTTMPNGEFVVTSNTLDGQRIIDNFVASNNGKTITMNVRTQALNPLPGLALPPAGDRKNYDGTIVGGLSKNANGNIVRAYAEGGLSPMSSRQATVVPPNTWRVVGDRATDDEFFIPDTDDPQHVSLGMEWARRRGLAVIDPKALAAMAGGGLGLGGYSGPDTSDYLAPTNLYEAASLAAGLGFTAVSGVSGLAGMAASGKFDLSKLTPEFDTSNTTVPLLDKGLSQLSDVMNQILDTLQKGGLVQTKIDVDTNTGGVGAQLTKAGFA